MNAEDFAKALEDRLRTVELETNVTALHLAFSIVKKARANGTLETVDEDIGALLTRATETLCRYRRKDSGFLDFKCTNCDYANCCTFNRWDEIRGKAHPYNDSFDKPCGGTFVLDENL